MDFNENKEEQKTFDNLSEDLVNILEKYRGKLTCQCICQALVDISCVLAFKSAPSKQDAKEFIEHIVERGIDDCL